MKHVHVHLGIITLTTITGIGHLVIGITQKDNLLILNGIGYIALLLALYISVAPLKNYKSWFRTTLLIYTVITFFGYFLMHSGISIVHAHGGSTPTPPDSDTQSPAANQLSSEKIVQQPTTTQLIENRESHYDLLGLSLKGTEVLLIAFLGLDGVYDSRQQHEESPEQND